MSNSKINLLTLNANKLDNVKGSFGMNVFKKCNALNLTLRNLSADIEKVNSCIDLIKNNSSVFSNFRGNNLLTTSVNLSMETNPEESFDELISIYNKLKAKFFASQFLVLAAQVIFNARDRIDVDLAIDNTRLAYDHMKKNHFFLTGQGDISEAALIATTSSNLDQSFIEIEECYKILKSNGFFVGNNLQSLSHILSLFQGEPKDKCRKVISLDAALKKHNVPLKGFGLPILGVAAFVTDDYELLSKSINETNEYLKKQPGFGGFSLGNTVRNMISTSLVSLDFVENNNDNIKGRLIEATNNAALNIILAIQIAATSSSIAAASATTAAN